MACVINIGGRTIEVKAVRKRPISARGAVLVCPSWRRKGSSVHDDYMRPFCVRKPVCILDSDARVRIDCRQRVSIVFRVGCGVQGGREHISEDRRVGGQKFLCSRKFLEPAVIVRGTRGVIRWGTADVVKGAEFWAVTRHGSVFAGLQRVEPERVEIISGFWADEEDLFRDERRA